MKNKLDYSYYLPRGKSDSRKWNKKRREKNVINYITKIDALCFYVVSIIDCAFNIEIFF